MSDIHEAVTQISGKHFYYCFLAGSQSVFEKHDYLNLINVFPVPDGDTGTNVCSTLQSIIENVSPLQNMKQMLSDISDAALTGARGNSGIIIAQFLYGVSFELLNQEMLNVETFSKALKKAINYAYDAISNPTEGTIITVIREWSEFIYDSRNKYDDFVELLVKSLDVAKNSLQNTTNQLSHLRKAGVVDSGAQAFVFFLEGVVELVKSQSIKILANVRSHFANVSINTEIIDHNEISFRYCTEGLISGKDLSTNALKNMLAPMGDSIVVAGNDTKKRIHIHTNDPSLVFSKLTENTKLLYQKVDDMVLQFNIAHHRKADIAIVTDSCCDLPKEYVDKYQIHIVPLSIFDGESTFLDNVTITPDQFYEKLKVAKIHPRTSQPTPKEFINKFNYLSSHYKHIIVLPCSKKLSGTYQNSYTSARSVSEQTDVSIHVIDTLTQSGNQGMLIIRVAEFIATGASIDDTLNFTRSLIGKGFPLVSLSTIKYALKGGRISRSKGIIGSIFNLKPIVSIDLEGNPISIGKYFVRKQGYNYIKSRLKELVEKDVLWNYTLSYTNREEAENALRFKDELVKIAGKEPLFVGRLTPVLGCSGGLGCFVVSIMAK